MFPPFGYIDSAAKLGDYCRRSLLDNGDKTHTPLVPNKTWELHKCLRLTDELIGIFDELQVFGDAAKSGYRFREEPTLIRWTYEGGNRGAADHYHHDGHFGKGGQVSLMLLLEENMGKTHMRIVPNSRFYFGRRIYDFLWRLPFKGRGRFLRLNDRLIELFHKPIRLEGPQDRLYYFNAGDNLHKAAPVKNTTRTIFHLNLTLFESSLSKTELERLSRDSLSPTWRQLLLSRPAGS